MLTQSYPRRGIENRWLTRGHREGSSEILDPPLAYLGFFGPYPVAPMTHLWYLLVTYACPNPNPRRGIENGWLTWGPCEGSSEILDPPLAYLGFLGPYPVAPMTHLRYLLVTYACPNPNPRRGLENGLLM